MANTFELSGTLKVLEETQTFASGFSKREFVIEVPDGKYPQMVKFEVVRDKIDLLNSMSIGDELKVISNNMQDEEFGIFQGINEEGKMLLKTSSELKSISSGECSIKGIY